MQLKELSSKALLKFALKKKKTSVWLPESWTTLLHRFCPSGPFPKSDIPACTWPCCWYPPSTPENLHHWGTDHTIQNLWVTLLSCGLSPPISAPILLLVPAPNFGGIPLLWWSHIQSISGWVTYLIMDWQQPLESSPPRTILLLIPSHLIIIPKVSPSLQFRQSP